MREGLTYPVCILLLAIGMLISTFLVAHALDRIQNQETRIKRLEKQIEGNKN